MSSNHHAHPHWNGLLRWLASHGMATHDLRVEARSSPGAGYGLFATRTIKPSTPLFTIPATALMNYLTLEPHYHVSRPNLSCTQIVSMHLLLHRPPDANSPSGDSLFGPFISVLPREMDWHPLTWLWKENVYGPGLIGTQLLDALPRSITERLNKMFGLFEIDWKGVQDYLRENPTVTCRRSHRIEGNCEIVAKWEEDYLWAWLIVNTRCIYHRLAKTRSHPDNLTLCPILDFANHTYMEKFAYPGITRAERFDTGPTPKFGENFVLLSPSTSTVVPGEQLFLRYGMHPNSTLFAEYGFVNVVDWHNQPESFSAEVEIDSYMETLFEKRGELGSLMKDVLLEEGYWRDWTMQMSPSPAHPSYRLITALRLYHVFPPQVTKIPSSLVETLLDEWRNTTLGKQDVISEDNERLWREDLMRICAAIKAGAGLNLLRIKKVKGGGSMDWLESVKWFIETLWEEENYVAKEVMKSLEANTDF